MFAQLDEVECEEEEVKGKRSARKFEWKILTTHEKIEKSDELDKWTNFSKRFQSANPILFNVVSPN